MNELSSPIIVIGMHRSGTSMVSRMLEATGLFLGHKKEGNNESLFFLEIDRWLISQSGASWENPAPIRYLLENRQIRAMTVDYMRRYLIDSPRVISFLGWKNYLQHRSLFKMPAPWGWKCPWTTFTLPLWRDLFPNAKVLHIYRHGVDVANSLRKRTLGTLEQTPAQDLYYKLRFLHWMKPKAGGFIQGMRCATLEGGLSLWEEYVAEARAHVRELGEQAIEVRYEDLLAEPVRRLGDLVEFCGIPPSAALLAKATALVRKQRAYAYRSSPELNAFAHGVAERLQAQNY
ncbi:MAG TPA: sulfotransferase [Terriglobia bacterium]|nr:sulfotransferase [Terriglobia bacterium]